jgi:hypothetical protein
MVSHVPKARYSAYRNSFWLLSPAKPNEMSGPIVVPFHYSSCTIRSPEILATIHHPTNLLIPVFAWLTLLANAGVDLLDYGRKEKLINSRNRRGLNIFCPVHSLRWRNKIPCQMWAKFWFTFSYGARPQDWQFWLILGMDNSFREFWDMVDHLERAMPGYFDDYESEDGSELDF